MNLRPINDKIVVRREDAEAVTPGGIVIPDVAKEKPRRGKVLAVGSGRLLQDGTRAAFQVKEGDHVLFTNYAGNEVKVGGEQLLILSEDEVLGIVD